jgi:hypothetical protein
MAGYTKRALVLAAFSEIGLAPSTFDLQADQILDAGNRLDALMADWDARGIHVGYPITNPDTIDLDAQSTVPQWTIRAIICNLAVELGPSYGREAQPSTKTTAKQGFITIMARTTSPPIMPVPSNMPSGAGNKPWLTTSNPFLTPASSSEIAAEDEGIDLE